MSLNKQLYDIQSTAVVAAFKLLHSYWSERCGKTIKHRSVHPSKGFTHPNVVYCFTLPWGL